MVCTHIVTLSLVPLWMFFFFNAFQNDCITNFACYQHWRQQKLFVFFFVLLSSFSNALTNLNVMNIKSYTNDEKTISRPGACISSFCYNGLKNTKILYYLLCVRYNLLDLTSTHKFPELTQSDAYRKCSSS